MGTDTDAELGRLSKLELMVLADNDLRGEIPSELDGPIESVEHDSIGERSERRDTI